jgi:DisA checkpoint controller-like protein
MKKRKEADSNELRLSSPCLQEPQMNHKSGIRVFPSELMLKSMKTTGLRARTTLMLRANSRLRQTLGESGVRFLSHAAGAIQRILPHVQVSEWEEGAWAQATARWTSTSRIELRITLAIGQKSSSTSRSLVATVRRRQLAGVDAAAGRTLDEREWNICKLIALRISEVLKLEQPESTGASIRAISDAFDEYIVAQHVERYHELTQMRVSAVLDALHTLSEQSYENKALTFGCIVEPEKKSTDRQGQFPEDFLESKKYKALSDGFRTAYHISANGKILGFVDLDRFEKAELTEKHYYPDWAEPIARASRAGRCGIALSRQGDILVFDNGTLRFTYRYGRWQYWNHARLVRLLRGRARAQRVPTRILGRVVGAIYRAALDVSFRRSGGLFVVLHNRAFLRDVVRDGDAIGDSRRSPADQEFDEVVREHNMQSLPRVVAVELASLDGAVVLDNSGGIRAYGAVLQPKKAGRLRGTEGSRTKAAIGASKYGLAVKISSDGEITVYYEGKEFIKM